MENATVDYDHLDKDGLANLFDKSGKTSEGKQVFHIVVRTPKAPDPVQIYVFGGYGSWVGLLNGGADITTEKVELPANWDELVQKYQNIVPNYLKY